LPNTAETQKALISASSLDYYDTEFDTASFYIPDRH